MNIKISKKQLKLIIESMESNDEVSKNKLKDFIFNYLYKNYTLKYHPQGHFGSPSDYIIIEKKSGTPANPYHDLITKYGLTYDQSSDLVWDWKYDWLDHKNKDKR